MRTEPTPASACGSSMLQLEKPNSRPKSPCSHREAGSLSTVMKDPGSREPKNQAFQLTLALLTAAA